MGVRCWREHRPADLVDGNRWQGTVLPVGDVKHVVQQDAGALLHLPARRPERCQR